MIIYGYFSTIFDVNIICTGYLLELTWRGRSCRAKGCQYVYTSLTLGLTASYFSGWICHKIKIVHTAWSSRLDQLYVIKAAFPRAKFLCHISHALQSLSTHFCGIIMVNLYSRTDTDAKWINNNYNFGINDCRACNLWQRKFGRVLELTSRWSLDEGLDGVYLLAILMP